MVYTFKLRPGLKFSDGTPLVAADVAASFKRYMTDKNNANLGLFASIKTVTAPNPATAVFTLKGPSGSFLTLLAEPNFIISPSAGLADPKTFYLKPISAGQYMISSFTPSQTTLVRNPNYFGPRRAIPQLQFIYVKDTNTRIIQVRSGQLDFAQNIPGRHRLAAHGGTPPRSTRPCLAASTSIRTSAAESWRTSTSARRSRSPSTAAS